MILNECFVGKGLISKHFYKEKRVVLKRFLILILVITISALLCSCDSSLKWEDFNGGVHLEMVVEPAEDVNQTDLNIDKIINIMIKRLKTIDINNAIIQRHENRIIVQLGHEKQLERIIRVVQKPAVIEFKLVDEKYRDGNLPAMYEKRFQIGTNQPLILRKKTLLNNQMIEEVKKQYNTTIGEYYLSLQFTRTGAMLFKKITSDNIGKRLAILIDGEIYMAPVIQTVIPGGRAQVTGNFDGKEGSDLALMLKHGPYPHSVKMSDNKKLTEDLWLGKNPSQDLIIIKRDFFLMKLLKRLVRKFLIF